VKKPKFNIQTIHSAVLTTDSSVNPNPINWTPDYWLVVARMTAGYIWIYAGAQRSGISFRVDRGSVKFPFETDNLTVETVGATGFYDVYAVHDPDEQIEIEA
jgi:hypothetical protein